MNRRDFLRVASVSLASAVMSRTLNAEPSTEPAMLTRPIPSTKQPLPVIGMGTWQTFNVRDLDDPAKLQPQQDVLRLLHAAGGRLIDSSPMYGSAEDVVGLLTERLGIKDQMFLATKVWTTGKEQGVKQMEASFAKFRRKDRIELMQVHNLVDWQTQLATLRDWKAQSRFRYIGVTHYSLSQFDKLEQIISNEKLDFVQLPYSLAVREAEKRLLPAAKDHGVAVLTMRPFEGGDLFGKTKGKPLPDSVKAYANSWPEAFLKFLIGHDAITCVIPATSKPEHMKENLGAGFGKLPDENQRRELIKFLGL